MNAATLGALGLDVYKLNCDGDCVGWDKSGYRGEHGCIV